jgi:hypothetical protein
VTTFEPYGPKFPELNAAAQSGRGEIKEALRVFQINPAAMTPLQRTLQQQFSEWKNSSGKKKGGTVKRNKPKPKKGSTVRGAGIARQGVRKAKIR